MHNILQDSAGRINGLDFVKTPEIIAGNIIETGITEGGFGGIAKICLNC
jgi:hypothetical protein